MRRWSDGLSRKVPPWRRVSSARCSALPAWWLATCMLATSIWCTDIAHAQGASVADATPAQKKEATKTFLEGMKAFDKEDYEKALEHFQSSYDAVQSPNSLLMVARTEAKLGRLLEARRTLQQTIEVARAAQSVDEKYAKAETAAVDELELLDQELVLIRVSIADPKTSSTVRIGDRTFTQPELEEPVAALPGSISVELVEDGTSVASETLTVQAGEKRDVRLVRPAPARDATPVAVKTETSGLPDKRTLAYVAGGVGVAGLVTFGVFGVLNNAKFGDLEDQCPDRVCPADLQGEADAGRTYQTVANIGLVVGIVGLSTGAVLYYLNDEDPKKESARRLPRVDVGLGSVTVSGSF